MSGTLRQADVHIQDLRRGVTKKAAIAAARADESKTSFSRDFHSDSAAPVLRQVTPIREAVGAVRDILRAGSTLR